MSGFEMGKNNSRRDRRDANVIASRYVIKTKHYYHQKPRLHVPPSPRTPVADAILRPSSRPPQPLADNRLYHPLGRSRPVVGYSGTQQHRKRLYDAPRALKTTSKTWSQRRHSAAVQRSVYVANRFGPMLDRQTKAILAFAEPKQIPLCHKRQARKQVLHAKGIAGGRVSKPHYKENSRITCR